MTTRFEHFWILGLAVVLAFGSNPAAQASDGDPLPSWNEGANKSAILEFVAASTNEDGADFIPIEDRIATFDMDGTLVVEKPKAAVSVFSSQYLSGIAEANPNLDIQPYRAIREADEDYLAKNVVQVLNAAGAGLPQSEYRDRVTAFGKTFKHERFDKPFGELFYAPMIELVSYLKANAFSVYIVSGSAQGFVRGFAKEATGLPQRQMIGTQWVLDFQGDGFMRTARFRNLGVAAAGKPVIIQYQIGQKPVFAFGNTWGDQQMLEYVLSHKDYKKLALWLDHDDEAREYLYDGRVKPADGLLKVSMKNDFKKLFAHD
ncbi:haloacid dehalogenase-like hydrolase [Nisaea nitritireducens]|uniref:haloacid dehalogenase-like hydrolase n=1 Tax=Nisaea nitritireducens TaxID=568392 RepID=UPI00186913E2|nr:HAD family hydrolase [Nisaea nitritireducens]